MARHTVARLGAERLRELRKQALVYTYHNHCYRDAY
jgi:hypothetical protein